MGILGNFFKDYHVCTDCKYQYGFNEIGVCVACLAANCADCLSDYTVCIACVLGFGLNSSNLC